MSTENLSVNAENDESELIIFDDIKVTTGQEINKKISVLDTDLAQLRMELGVINTSVEEGLDRLGDTDTDLTAKVSETYKRLGEIDSAYKSLMVISSRINRDIQKLDGDVSRVAEKASSGIKNLDRSTILRTHEFTQRNQQVATSVSRLVETSKVSSELLDQKIQSTTDIMLQIEKRVISEIETLSNTSKEKTNSLETSVDNTRAKIIKLQSIDEAIIRRATTLEISSAELTVASQNLSASVEHLESSSNLLSSGLGRLKSRTVALEQVSSKHGSLISGLQKATSEITDKFAMLAARENKRFNLVSGGFLFLLIVTAIIYIYQQTQFVERSEVVDGTIVDLQQSQASSGGLISDSLVMLENKILRMSSAMQDVEDQVQSVDGRLNEASPFSHIGDDNIIHGAQWISALPEENFIVQLALTTDKEAMFEIAHRYNFYLKDSLSYFEVKDEREVRYALLSGNYATRQQAHAAIESMPTYIDMQRPVLREVTEVQAYIVQ